MALSGFLVPFATGALIERQRIADAYDEKSGEIVDAVSKKLTSTRTILFMCFSTFIFNKFNLVFFL